MDTNTVTVNVKIQDTELFQDIIDLVKKYSENNPKMLDDLIAIMNKHSAEHEYSIIN